MPAMPHLIALPYANTFKFTVNLNVATSQRLPLAQMLPFVDALNLSVQCSLYRLALSVFFFKHKPASTF